MRKERQSNFELMRIVSMLFIILWHVILHGKVVENSQNLEIDTIINLIKHFIIIHVNSFVLVLGFFQFRSKFKLSKVLSLVFQTLFYSIIIFVILYKLGFVNDINFTTIMNVLIPFSSTDYWFISNYLITYILSDYINLFLKNLSYQKLKKFIILCFILFSVIPFITRMRFVNNNGFNFYHFIFLYILGAYLHLYPPKESNLFKKISINGYRLLLVLLFVICASYNFFLQEFAVNHYYNNGQVFNYLSSIVLISQGAYSSPIVIIQSVCYFELFRTLKINSRIINYISSCVFGIYLFHDNSYLRQIIYKISHIDNGLFFGRRILLKILVVVIAIFIVGCVIELIRKFLVKLIHKTLLYKKIRLKFYNYIESFNE